MSGGPSHSPPAGGTVHPGKVTASYLLLGAHSFSVIRPEALQTCGRRNFA
jgi:hypothetical protein